MITGDGHPTYKTIYNNFHISALDFWRTSLFHNFFQLCEEKMGYLKYRWGDANSHAFIVGIFLKPEEVKLWNHFAYSHNYHYHPIGTSSWLFQANNLEWLNNRPPKTSCY